MATNYLASISHYIPELVICVTFIALVLLECSYSKEESKRSLLYWVAAFGLLLGLGHLLISYADKPIFIFTNSIVIDGFSSFMKIIMTLGTLGVVYLVKVSRDLEEKVKPEFLILSFGVLVGGMILVSANNMLMLYIGIETLSILSYVMASLKKRDPKSIEGGLKYVLYGGVASGIMLFGMSHLYGLLGTIHFVEIAKTMNSLEFWELTSLGISFLLFFVGIGYKIACVPFHMWSPDVYEGAPLPVTTFFSIVPKVAGLGALVRVTHVFFMNEGLLQTTWFAFIAFVAAITMTLGNITAIEQSSIKRLLAYSGISHIGMMMMGVLVVSSVGVSSLLFYLFIYLFMTLVAFYVSSFVIDEEGKDDLSSFNGLMERSPYVAICMAITMFSLAGIPPFGGFIAKFTILSGMIQEKYYALAVVVVVNSVISLYYYMRIVRCMIFNPSSSKKNLNQIPLGFFNQFVVILLVIPILFLGIFWQKIMIFAESAKVLLAF